MPDLSTTVGSLKLKNPVTVASGTFGYGQEFQEFYDPSILGAVFLKGLTTRPRTGNETPRLVETPSGLINSIGLQNIGIDEFVQSKWRELEKIDSAICANLSGDTIDEFVELASKACTVPIIRALEVNISCPNIKAGGVEFGRSPAAAREITRRVVEISKVPVLVKLTPNVTDVVEIAAAVMEAGAAGVTLVNTFLAMAIDIERRKPVLTNIMGGLSGPCIKPIAVRMVWQVYKALKCPILGMGGIMTGADALEFILAGASAISIGTANFVNPTAGPDILAEISEYCEPHGVKSIAELVGAAHAA
ncbi:MAG: dihydroorotate dehydrogenase [Candidatus Sumerlaeaceae bacterium]|nr:dihydroorotate dehydrogenase [Candidatus Sumerlaeaceae bacterium]